MRHTEVSGIQATSQTRLKGSPSTTGWIRSQRGTERHIPTTGIPATATERQDGVLIGEKLGAWLRRVKNNPVRDPCNPLGKGIGARLP
jgi:hypothetical protein